MTRIEVLEKRQSKLTAEIRSLADKAEKCEDITELRKINEDIDSLQADISQIEAELTELRRSNNPTQNVDFRNLKRVSTTEKRDEDFTDSIEYRTAFKDYVLRKKPIPAELRANESTTTSDVSAVIPTVLVNKIIERMDECGMILPHVTKTNYTAGIVIPTSNVKPVATWVSEGKGSEKQKKSTGSVTFNRFKLRCEISMSMETGTMALAAFEAKFIENVSKAMVIAQEKAVLNGNGTTQPKGIFKEKAVYTKELATVIPTYEELIDIEAHVPAEFEGSAKWIMTKPQFMNFVAMTDKNGQPIARVNYGINGQIERSILGRDVVIHPYSSEMSDNVAAIFNFSDYVLNTVYDMGIQHKQDWDTEDLLTKAVMSVDGKVVDAGSLIKVTVATATK